MCGQDEKDPEVFEWAIAQEEIVYHRLQEMLDYIESAWTERGPFDGTQDTCYETGKSYDVECSPAVGCFLSASLVL